MDKPSVLVTGGAGYIGSQVCKMLAEQNQSVVVIDNLSTGHTWTLPKAAIFYNCNIADTAQVLEILSRHQLKSVIHMAASVDVNESMQNPIKYFQNNVTNALHFLDACVRAQVKNFVFSSTAAVYGNPKQSPVDELAPLCPESPYGASKKIMEDILQSVAKSSGMSFAILRYFNVAGAALDGTLGQVTENATHLIKVASETAAGLRPSMKIFGSDYATRDGTAERDFIHIEDLAEIHLLMLRHLHAGSHSEIFNCGYGKGFTVKEIVETMQKISKNPFVVEMSERRLGDVEKVIANPQKLNRILQWKPRFNDIETICRTAFEWEVRRKKSLQS